jgi:PAS domain S-box-containing protein
MNTAASSRFQAGKFMRILPRPAPDFMDRFRARLHDPRFWVIQAMVIAVTVVHAGVEVIEHGLPLAFEAAYFIPVSLYLFPVLYASLNFGKEGAIPTAVWSAALAVPNILLWHHGAERLGEVFQVSVMLLLAVLVASRVDRETLARRSAQAVEQRRRISELKYRALFDAAGEACLVIDGKGVIRDANAAASSLLGRSTASLVGSGVSDLLNLDVDRVRRLAQSQSAGAPELKLSSPISVETWVQPICTLVPAEEDHDELLQILLQDVTDRRRIEFYAHEIVRALEDERRRIAQEIHDVSVQSLVLLCRRLDAVGLDGADPLPESAIVALAEARRSAEEVGDELRRFSRDLRPVVLEDLGLTPAIRRLVAEIEARTVVTGRFNAVGIPRRLGTDAELSLFRIAQEALRNAELHAAASQVSVKLRYGAHEVRLTVSDDGRGFDPSSQARLTDSGHLGLLGMQERARLAGGTCSIESQPGRGTKITACVPVGHGGRG